MTQQADFKPRIGPLGHSMHQIHLNHVGVSTRCLVGSMLADGVQWHTSPADSPTLKPALPTSLPRRIVLGRGPSCPCLLADASWPMDAKGRDRRGGRQSLSEVELLKKNTINMLSFSRGQSNSPRSWRAAQVASGLQARKPSFQLHRRSLIYHIIFSVLQSLEPANVPDSSSTEDPYGPDKLVFRGALVARRTPRPCGVHAVRALQRALHLQLTQHFGSEWIPAIWPVTAVKDSVGWRAHSHETMLGLDGALPPGAIFANARLYRTSWTFDTIH
jgi:hypothetical protein